MHLTAANKRRRAYQKRITEIFPPTITWDWNLLPTEMKMRILALLPTKDLARLSAVSKEWKGMIFHSESFHKLHSQHCQPESCILYLPDCRTKEDELEVKFFGDDEHWFAAFIGDIEGICHDGGLLCKSSMLGGTLIVEVGNPVLKIWKKIKNPSDGLMPRCIMVNRSSGDYLILAANDVGAIKVTEVFDSRLDVWRKGQTLDYDSDLQDKLLGSVLGPAKLGGRAATYSFEHDNWTHMFLNHPSISYDENEYQLDIVLCKDRLILAALGWMPHIALWIGYSCNNGIMEWSLMTDFKGEQLIDLMPSNDLSINFEDWTDWYPWRVCNKEDSITVAVVARNNRRYSLLQYDLLTSSWQLLQCNGELFDTNFLLFFPSFVYP